MLTFRFALLSPMLGQCPHCHAKLEPMSGPARAGGRIFGDGTVGVSSQGEMMGANMRVSMGMPQVHSGNFGNLRGGDMGAGMGSSSRPQYLGGGVSMHMGGRDYNQYPGDEYPGDGTFFPTSQMPNFPNASMRNSPGDAGQQYRGRHDGGAGANGTYASSSSSGPAGADLGMSISQPQMDPRSLQGLGPHSQIPQPQLYPSRAGGTELPLPLAGAQAPQVYGETGTEIDDFIGATEGGSFDGDIASDLGLIGASFDSPQP